MQVIGEAVLERFGSCRKRGLVDIGRALQLDIGLGQVHVFDAGNAVLILALGAGQAVRDGGDFGRFRADGGLGRADSGQCGVELADVAGDGGEIAGGEVCFQALQSREGRAEGRAADCIDRGRVVRP